MNENVCGDVIDWKREVGNKRKGLVSQRKANLCVKS